MHWINLYHRQTFKTAFLAFICLRLWISLLGILGSTVMPIPLQTDYPNSPEMVRQLDSNELSRLMISPWYRFDTVHYLTIAQQGYQGEPYEAAFAPLYPLLIYFLTLLLHSPMVSALMISNLAALITFWLFLILVQEWVGEKEARHALFYLVIFPSSFILMAAYTESLFFALLLACLLSIRQKRWYIAGLLAGLASLTRFQGVFIALIFIWFSYSTWQEHQNWRQHFSEIYKPLLAGAIPIIFFLSHALIIHFVYKAPWPWDSLSLGWNHHLGWPWEGISGNISAILTYNLTLFHFSLIFDLIAAVIVPLFLMSTREKIHPAYLCFFWALYLSAVTKVTHEGTLTSVFRYLIPVVPVYIGINQWIRKPGLKLIFLAFSISLQALLTLMFYKWIWIF